MDKIASSEPRGNPRVVAKNIKSIYIPDNQLFMWEQFKTSMREDASSASAQIILWIQDWYNVHPDRQHRNPQTSLLRQEFTDPESIKQSCPNFAMNYCSTTMKSCFYSTKYQCPLGVKSN